VTEEILVESAGRVLRVTLNRPRPHNALSRSMLSTLKGVFERSRAVEDLACVVLTGAGERYFAAGGDLRDLASVREEADVVKMAEASRAALDAVRNFPLPVIAVLNGDAIGGGAELAVACDFRLMREGAHVGYVQGRLAISSGWGGGTDLVDLVGPARALRMMTRAELVSADTACAWGLADAVFPVTGLDAALEDFVQPIVAQASLVLRSFKAQAIAARRGLPYAERRAAEQAAFVATWIHSDHWSAVDRILPSARR